MLNFAVLTDTVFQDPVGNKNFSSFFMSNPIVANQVWCGLALFGLEASPRLAPVF